MGKSTYHYSYAKKRRRIPVFPVKYLAAGLVVLALFAGVAAIAIRGWRPSFSLTPSAALLPSTGGDLGAFAYDGAAPGDHRRLQAREVSSNTRAPATPTDLVATTASESEINLTWQLQGDNEAGVVIQRSDDETTWQTVHVAPAGAALWTDTSLYPARAYHYRIAAINHLGSSGYTRPVGAVTLVYNVPNALMTPVGVKATPTSPTTATVNFTDPNASQSNRDYTIERSSDGGLTYAVVGTCGYGYSGPYHDSLLTPGATYYYRIRGLSDAVPNSNYTDPVSVTMPQVPPGMPRQPRNTAVINDNSTTNTITWTDTNNGAAQYVVERSGGGPNFAEVGQVAAGASHGEKDGLPSISFMDTTCSPEISYIYEVKAVNGNGSSGFDQPVYVTTASVGTGSPKVYNIGPGQTYPTIGSFNWRLLGPGDTVNIHGNGSTPYYELLLLTVRGTAAAPITIQGVPDGEGNYPILDGTNAVQNSQFVYNYARIPAIGCITTYHAATADEGFRPGYLVIKNLELRNCYQGDGAKPGSDIGRNTWTDYQGKTQPYGSIGGGIYLLTGDNITIEGCNIHGNGEGVFGAGQPGFDRYMANIVLRGNYIWGNGNIGSSKEHGSYIESVGALYEYNHYGPERAGAGGSSLKDRSVGTVIRYNWIDASARILDLVEAENDEDAALAMPAYHDAFVYGNILALNNPNCAYPIHYGGDLGNWAAYRKGILYFWNNTVVCTIAQRQQWKSTVFQLSSPGEALDARNNIIAFRSLAGGNSPELDLLPSNGIAYFGVNWITSGWRPTFNYPAYPFNGIAGGTEHIISGADPGFVNWANADYHLSAGSPCIGVAGPLSRVLARYPLDYEYRAATTAQGIPGRTPRRDGATQAAMRIKVFHRSTPGVPDLGVGASLNGKRVFPADNPWNQRVDNLPVDPNSAKLIASIGANAPLHPDFGGNWDGKPFGIPYMVVAGDTRLRPVTFDYAQESDPGPYPVPPNAPIEDAADPDADHHVLVIDRDHWKLYELYGASWTGGGWHAGSGAVFDLSSNALRPDGWTSADAAGLPIFPGLVRYDEVVGQGEIDHALRFTVRRTRRAYVFPARHCASHDTDPNLPPMGMRVRLKASVDISTFPPQARVVLQALKTYGMILADNGGNWFVSGAPDSRWDDSDLNSLKRLHGSDFEVVKMGPETTE